MVATCPASSGGACDEAEKLFDRIHVALEDEPNDAIRYCRQVLDSCPVCPHATVDLARAFIAVGEADAAAVIVDEWLDKPSDWMAEFLVLKGELTVQAMGVEASLPFRKRAVDLEPDSHNHNCNLASALLKLERFDEALPYAQAAWSADSEQECSVVNLLYCLRSAGKKTELRRALRQLRSDGEQNPEVLNQLARSYALIGRKGIALRVSKDNAERHPTFVPAWCLSAGLQYELGYANEAEKSLQKVYELDPDGHRGYFVRNMANISGFIRGDWKRALEGVVKARVDRPDDPEIVGVYNHVVDAVLRNLSVAREESAELSKQFAAIHKEHDDLKVVFEGFEGSEQGTPIGIALQKLEGQDIELMDRFPDQARDLAKEIAAFSTSNDGSIFLGIADDGTVVGMTNIETPKSRDSLVDRIAGITTNSVAPPVRVEVYFRQYGDETVVKIFVPKGLEPLYYVNGTPYVRHLDQSRPALPDEVKQLVLHAGSKIASQ